MTAYTAELLLGRVQQVKVGDSRPVLLLAVAAAA
jgi:hypothetical protein